MIAPEAYSDSSTTSFTYNQNRNHRPVSVTMCRGERKSIEFFGKRRVSLYPFEDSSRMLGVPGPSDSYPFHFCWAC